MGLTPIQEVAHSLEIYLQTLEHQPMTMTSDEFDALQRCLDHVKHMMQQVALGEMPTQKSEILQLLNQMQQAAATPAASAPTLVEEHIDVRSDFTADAPGG